MTGVERRRLLFCTWLHYSNAFRKVPSCYSCL